MWQKSLRSGEKEAWGGGGGGGGKKSTPRRQTITDVLIITIHDN